MAQQFTIEEFAKSIKAKYPQYANIPDAELTGKMLAKYPQYRANIKPAGREAASTSEFEKNLPQSTIGTRAREAAIGVLEPFTAQAIGSTVKQAGTIAYDALSGNKTKSLTELWDALKGIAGNVVNPVVNVEEGFRTGDYDRAAYGAGGFLSQTVPAVEGAYKGTVEGAKTLADVTDLKSKARNIGQRATGQTAADTSAKTFKAYSEEAAEVPGKQKAAADEAAAKTAEKQANVVERTAEKQANEQARVAEKNKAETLAVKKKNEAAQQKYQAGVKSAEEEAQTKTQEQTAQFEKTQQLHQDSARLGTQTEDLNEKLKGEADEKYQPVHDATAADEGETLVDQAKTAKDFLKGSSENIKQFREVLAGDEGKDFFGKEFGGEGESPNLTGHPLRAAIEGEIEKGEPTKYSFADIQGYKQELDAKLGAGNLLPDVYNALKSFRDSLDAAAKTIADRNNVGPQLEEANAFYRDWKQLFTDNARNESAVGDVLNRVKRKTTDPEFYHEPFTKGKASGVAIDRLRNLKTRYSTEANSLADLSKQLRDRYNTGDKPANYLGQRPSAVQPKTVVAPTPVKGEVYNPRTIPTPTVKPVKPKNVAIPGEPNVGEIIQKRAEAVGQQGRGMQKLSAYDIRRLGYPVLGAFVGHPWAGLAVGVGTELLQKGVGYALDMDKVKQFIAAPTEADVTAAQQLPEPARSNVVKGLRDIIDQENAAGRKLRVAPSVMRLIAQPAIIRNRKDALEKLGK